jgi:hypothetical protein
VSAEHRGPARVEYTDCLDSTSTQADRRPRDMGEILGIGVTRYPGLIVPDERMGPLLTRTPESGRGSASTR